MANSSDSNRDYVRAFARGLAIIEAFGSDHPSMTLSEVAKKTGMARAAARRFLLTLESLGHVRSDDGRFSLGPSVLSLGYAYLSGLEWWEIILPYLEDLTKTVQESCSASVLDRTEIVYVARVAATRIMSINLNVGSRLPAYATSMGRVLLAHLPAPDLDDYFSQVELVKHTKKTCINEKTLRRILLQVRKDGYSLVDQELEVGLRSIAVPLFDRQNNPVAAINLSTHIGRKEVQEIMDDFLPILLETSRSVSAKLPVQALIENANGNFKR